MGKLKEALLESATQIIPTAEAHTEAANQNVPSAEVANENARPTDGVMLPVIAAPVPAPAPVEEFAMPPNFRMTEEGLEHIMRSRDGDITYVYVCTPVYVIAYARDANGSGWAKVVRVVSPDGQNSELVISSAELAADFNTVFRSLADEGLETTSDRRAKEFLRAYLTDAKPQRRMRLLTRTGWYNGAFLYGDRVIGNTGAEELRLKPGTPVNSRLIQGGTMSGWQATAALAVGNSRLVLAICTAFAAVLLEITKSEGGGFHFYGASSTGKSTMLFMAGAVYGGGDSKGFTRPWRMTANGMEALCSMHNDLVAVLDEIGEANPKELGTVVYQSINGQAKARMQANGALRKMATWVLTILSAGEKTIVQTIRDGGERVKAGQEARLADIPADAGAGYGVFENLHGFATAKELAEHIKVQSVEHYGWAAPAFIEKVIEHRVMVEEYVAEAKQTFAAEYVPAEADGQVSRVANRFALVAAAGELAIHWGILPWAEGEALNGAVRCFNDWLTQRGGISSAEVIRGIEQIVATLRMDGLRLFDEWREKGGVSAVEGAKATCYGWRKLEGGIWEYYAHAEGFTNLLHGFDRTQLVPALIERGLLVPDPKGKSSVLRTIPGQDKQRYYHLRPHLYQPEAD